MITLKHVLVSFALASAITAHPGHDPREEALERRAYYASVPPIKRSLSHCAAELKARGLEQRSSARRQQLATHMRHKRGIASSTLEERDIDSVLNTTHLSNDTSINLDVPESSLFTQKSCILVPEVTQGPYYVQGEYIRRNITETQLGVPLTLEIQIVDVNTCDAVPDVYVDFWHANATGVYSGIVASGNGDSGDTSNVNSTFLRGIAETDAEGVASFESIVPGHYTSRANHIHIITHTNTTLYVNGTMSAGSVQHVGQLFFDTSLLQQVESTYPYNINTQDWTSNADDSILAEETATEGADPVVEYVLLGEDVSEGVLAWISVGVDMSNDQSVTAAGRLYRSGGVMEESQGMNGGGSSGNGGMWSAESGNGTVNGTSAAPSAGETRSACS